MLLLVQTLLPNIRAPCVIFLITATTPSIALLVVTTIYLSEQRQQQYKILLHYMYKSSVMCLDFPGGVFFHQIIFSQWNMNFLFYLLSQDFWLLANTYMQPLLQGCPSKLSAHQCPTSGLTRQKHCELSKSMHSCTFWTIRFIVCVLCHQFKHLLHFASQVTGTTHTEISEPSHRNIRAMYSLCHFINALSSAFHHTFHKKRVILSSSLS